MIGFPTVQLVPFYRMAGRPWGEILEMTARNIADIADIGSYLPGEGDIPIDEWVAAVKATGYDGSWSSELISPRHWEWDLAEIARQARSLMLKYIQPG